jgi:hypothetical protein
MDAHPLLATFDYNWDDESIQNSIIVKKLNACGGDNHDDIRQVVDEAPPSIWD